MVQFPMRLGEPTDLQGYVQLLLTLYVPLLLLLIAYKLVAYRAHRWDWRAFMLVGLALAALLYPLALRYPLPVVAAGAGVGLMAVALAETAVVRRAQSRLAAEPPPVHVVDRLDDD